MFQDVMFGFSENYVIVISVLLVLFLSVLLPNIRQELQTSNELKPMRKLLDKITYDVKQAEVACMAASSEICSLKTSLHDLTTQTIRKSYPKDSPVPTDDCIRFTQSVPTEVDKKPSFFRRVFAPTKKCSNKEVTIMSYLYTDSFDSKHEEKK